MKCVLSIRQDSRRTRRAKRGGYTLVLFVIMLFGILALAALVIDVGFARLAQRQMQTAVDAAALEGLRGRDDSLAANPDMQRRLQAAELVERTFDDDLDLSTQSSLGAGPVINYSSGIPLAGSSFSASQLISIDASPFYHPSMQLNVRPNLSQPEMQQGDMVAGEYSDDPELAHVESVDYSRSDFVPDQDGTEFEDGSESAFLVRMRRTNESFDPVNGIASSGPPVPYLFGHGGGVLRAEDDGFGNPVDPMAVWNQRARGINVWATAIAATEINPVVGAAVNQVGSAKVVGPAIPSEGISGCAHFAIYDELNDVTTFGWSDDWAIGQAFAVTLTPAGELEALGAGIIGQLLDLDQLEENRERRIGEPIGIPPLPGNFQPTSGIDYVPIVRLIAGERRIVGFGVVDLSATPFTITKQPSSIAPRNASAIPPSDSEWLSIMQSLSEIEVTDLFRANQETLQDALQAPVLVR